MEIRKAREEDIDLIMQILLEAKQFMVSQGNPNQWTNYPTKEIILEDVERGDSYVCDDNGEILSTFMYRFANDPMYDYIEDGDWLDDLPYAVVHRIATKRGSNGIGAYSLDWAYNASGNLRIDTHIDNIPMRNLLNKLGFTQVGTVYLPSGDSRLAFHKVKSTRF